MSWTRVAMAGGAAGVVSWICGFVLHGVVMAETYKRLSQVYTQTQATRCGSCWWPSPSA